VAGSTDFSPADPNDGSHPFTIFPALSSGTPRGKRRQAFATIPSSCSACRPDILRWSQIAPIGSEKENGSARVTRASSGVAPGLLTHLLPGFYGGKKFVEQRFRRDAENHTPEAYAPLTLPSRPLPISQFGFNTSGRLKAEL
jgi:hypothetical protein